VQRDSYGTILCDLESRKVIDLLPDRESGTVAAWLRKHPGSKIVSRDRGGIYAQATRMAASGAVQVADRWHLLRNLSEALKNALSPHHRLLAHAAKSGTGEASTLAPSPQPFVPPWELRAQQKNRVRRFSRYEEVQRLGKTGASHTSTALTAYCKSPYPHCSAPAASDQEKFCPRSTVDTALEISRQLKRGVQSVHSQHKKSGIVELFRTR
jgi:hypothetical protein